MIDVSGLSDDALLTLKADVDREARHRGLTLSIGEVGERLVINLFRERSDLPILVAAPRGTKNVDALSRDGERYSIKSLLHSKKTGTIYPDPDEPDRQLFEHLAVVLLSDDSRLERVVLFDWAQFVVVRSWDSRMKAWYVARSKRAFSCGRLIFPAQCP